MKQFLLIAVMFFSMSYAGARDVTPFDKYIGTYKVEVSQGYPQKISEVRISAAPDGVLLEEVTDSNQTFVSDLVTYSNLYGYGWFFADDLWSFYSEGCSSGCGSSTVRVQKSPYDGFYYLHHVRDGGFVKGVKLSLKK